MRDINVGNTDILENGDVKVTRKSKTGVVLALCLSIGIGSLYGLHLDNIYNDKLSTDVPTFSAPNSAEVTIRDEINLDDGEVIVQYIQENPINVSLEEINSLSIIINDCDCMEEFINAVCEELDKDGIEFSYTKNCQDIDVDDSVIITLDQQYSAGPSTLVFAPLENGRMGNSDALALAAERAFYEKGFLIDGIACGQMGFRENENGTISERVPTPAEEAISDDKNSSFVTISFGTQNAHPGLTAAGIEAALTRYYAYITGEYGYEDLIYCVELGEDYDDIAGKLNTSSTALDAYNDTTDESLLLTGETIINPIVKERREFNQHVPTNLYIDKTIWSK